MTYPDGKVHKLDESVYDKENRIIMVPIAKLNGGESYTLTYKAGVKIEKGTKQEDIVNRAEATGENPGGEKSPIKPTATASIKYPVDVIKTGDENNITFYGGLAGISGIYIGIYIYMKKRKKMI